MRLPGNPISAAQPTLPELAGPRPRSRHRHRQPTQPTLPELAGPRPRPRHRHRQSTQPSLPELAGHRHRPPAIACHRHRHRHRHSHRPAHASLTTPRAPCMLKKSVELSVRSRDTPWPTQPTHESQRRTTRRGQSVAHDPHTQTANEGRAGGSQHRRAGGRVNRRASASWARRASRRPRPHAWSSWRRARGGSP